VADHDLLAELAGLRNEHHIHDQYDRPERATQVAEQIKRVEGEIREEVKRLEAEADDLVDTGADGRAGQLREQAAQLRAGLDADNPAENAAGSPATGERIVAEPVAESAAEPAGPVETAADKTPRERATPKKRTG
jgi:hypothetical protein